MLKYKAKFVTYMKQMLTYRTELAIYMKNAYIKSQICHI